MSNSKNLPNSQQTVESPFASKTMTMHLVRGVLGFGSLWGAFQIVGTHPLVAVGLGLVMLVAFRGCPMCWTVGLFGSSCRVGSAKSGKCG